jgi:hypothetical protein
MLDAPPLINTTFGPARIDAYVIRWARPIVPISRSFNFESEAGVLFVAERPHADDADDACVLYVRGGRRKYEKPSSNYCEASIALLRPNSPKSIKGRRQ